MVPFLAQGLLRAHLIELLKDFVHSAHHPNNLNRKRSRNAHPLLDIQLPQFVPPSLESPKIYFAAQPDIDLYWYATNVLYYTWGLPDTHQSDPIASLSNPDSSEVSPTTEL